ncbi:MAG TPA: response regulator transcription factor [Anaerolineales bacterium]|nr:response regulator transcription factor [Anaerolineales bacterium]
MPNDKIRVVIVDDHPGVRTGIKKLLRRAKDITIVGEGGDGMKAIELASTKKPDILLLDVELPILGGDIVMRRIHDAEPDIRVLIVSTYNDRTYVQSMLANGASGYITKDEAPSMLLNAIYSVLQNRELWLSPRALENSGATLEEQTLTDREVEILRLLVMNRSTADIAGFVHMEEQQVMNYLQLLMDKFEASSIEELKVVARRVLPTENSGGTASASSMFFLL